MAKTKTAAKAAENAQEAFDTQKVSQNIREDESAPEAPGGQREDTVTREVIGPDSAEELLGCQDADGAVLCEVECIEYAVTGCGQLRLREEPRLDAPVAALLPEGVGVLGNSGAAQNGWRLVFTGRLVGWVMDEYLEALELPGDDDGAG